MYLSNLTPRCLGSVLSGLGEALSRAELEEMVSAVDMDRDGKLTYKEFARAMEHGVEDPAEEESSGDKRES